MTPWRYSASCYWKAESYCEGNYLQWSPAEVRLIRTIPRNSPRLGWSAGPMTSYAELLRRLSSCGKPQKCAGEASLNSVKETSCRTYSCEQWTFLSRKFCKEDIPKFVFMCLIIYNNIFLDMCWTVTSGQPLSQLEPECSLIFLQNQEALCRTYFIHFKIQEAKDDWTTGC